MDSKNSVNGSLSSRSYVPSQSDTTPGVYHADSVSKVALNAIGRWQNCFYSDSSRNKPNRLSRSARIKNQRTSDPLLRRDSTLFHAPVNNDKAIQECVKFCKGFARKSLSLDSVQGATHDLRQRSHAGVDARMQLYEDLWDLFDKIKLDQATSEQLSELKEVLSTRAIDTLCRSLLVLQGGSDDVQYQHEVDQMRMRIDEQLKTRKLQ